MSTLAIELIKECLHTKDTYLELGNFGLTDKDVAEGTEFDRLLRKCTHLETLILSNQWIEWNSSSKRISKSSRNKGINNLFNFLPPAVELLPRLRTLICGGTFQNKWNISSMQFVANLTSLQSLNLSYNNIPELKGLDNLASLYSLDLCNNKITEIKGLDNLASLSLLDINRNQITEIKGLDKLVNLYSLNIYGNQINEIKGLENLKKLNSLNISENQISEIKGLGNLKKLDALYISFNQITEIKGLGNLKKLNALYIGENKISEIKGLDNLKRLSLLHIGDNRISEIKGLGNLKSLYSLNISHNQIEEIKALVPFIKREQNPLKIVLREKMFTLYREINIEGNPIATPPMATVEQGNEAILRFFSEELEAKYEAKILIVGEPEAGKTSLMKKITDPAYFIPVEEDSTIGIQVIKWECKGTTLPESIKINLWDFGGQEMQYLTHQFFLSADALYLLLTSARKDYDNLDYWFNIISLLGKNENNQNSELLVVANEIKMQEGQISRVFDVKKYQDLYPHLPFSFQSVNLATAFDKDGRFTSLLHLLKEKLALLPILGKQLPVKWGVARSKLAALGVNYMHIDKYLQVCQEVGIDEKLALDLSNYLHTIGEAVHFKTDDYVILNPKWAVDGMYSILKRKDIEANDGHFIQEQVYAIWNKAGYTYPECNLLLSLMTKDSFEVAYRIPATRDEYIAPQLLSLIRPDHDWDKKDSLHFRYLYPFIPKGIITRLIVRLHKHIKYQNSKGMVWRTGVVFAKNGCNAKVEEIKIPTTGQQVIAIEIAGYKPNRKLLLYDVCSTIEGIHKDSFSKIIFERQIPCNCDHCKSLEQPGFYDYSELVEYLNEGIEKIRCKLKVKNELPVKLLLQDIFDVDFTKLDYISHHDVKKEIVNELLFNDPFGINKIGELKKKIFISYSQKDSHFKFTNGVQLNFIEGLKTHLKSLKRLGLADTWSDNDILAGEDWDAETKEELADADIILFLVSANLIATDYVWDEEMPLAKYHKYDKKTVIIPVILNHCDWQSIPLFSEQNVVPHKGKPIASYHNVEEAYNEITAKIKELIES